MTQDNPPDSPEVAALKLQTAKAAAEKEFAVAQLEKLQAEKNLAAAMGPVDSRAQTAAQSAADKAQAESQKAIADAQKAVFDQQKAAADARTAAIAAEQTTLKARFGMVAGSTAATGAVEIGEGAGNGEASMLAADAVRKAAEQIAEAVQRDCGKRHCVIYAGQQKPTFGHWTAFRVQIEITTACFGRADEAKLQAETLAAPVPVAAARPPGTASVDALASGAGAVLDLGAKLGVGGALDLVAKLGSYFQTDYKVMGATIAGSDDDLLAISVAGVLHDSWYPARWVPQSAQAITDLLKPLAASRDRSNFYSQAVAARLQQFKAEVDKTVDVKEKNRLNSIAAAYTHAAEAYISAQRRFDDLLTSLANVTDGVPLATYVADEKMVIDKLQADSLLLFVRLNAPAGGRYSKKNIWTFLGKMPFYVSGGAITSYIAIDPKSGGVQSAGQFTVHSGYYKVNEAAKQFLSTQSPSDTRYWGSGLH
jgi:hypothetical protein